jgi:hypothetical protein
VPVELTHKPQDFYFQGKQDLGRSFKVALTQVILFAWFVFAAWLTSVMPAPIASDYFLAFSWLPLLLWLGFHLTVLFHEFGHALTGLAADHQLIALTAGPLHLVRESKGLRMHLNLRRVLAFNGFTYTIPQKPDQALNRGWLLFLLGGPLATLLQWLLLVSIRAALDDRILPAWFTQTLWVLTFAALHYLFLSAVPLPFMVVPGDATQILTYFKSDPHLSRRRQLNWLTSRFIAGPRDLDREAITTVLHPTDGSDEEITANWLAYFHTLDQGDITTAAAHLDTVLGIHHSRQSAEALPYYFLEAAYLTARYSCDPETARAWLTLAQSKMPPHFSTKKDSSYLRSQAAIFLAEGKMAEANLLAKHSLAQLERTHELGTAQAAQEWLATLIDQTSPAATPLPARWQPPQPVIAQPITQRTTAEKISLFFITFCIVVVIGWCIISVLTY